MGSAALHPYADTLASDCFSGNVFEGFCDVYSRGGRREEQAHVVLLRKRLCHVVRYLLVVSEVALCGDDNFEDVFVGVLLNLAEPGFHVVEGSRASGVKRQNDTVCTLVVRLRDCAEPFLPCCVPDLKFHALPIHLQILYLEVDTWGQRSW